MPKVSDIVHGKDLGKTETYYARMKKYIYVKCPNCGIERWRTLRAAIKNGISRCNHCCGVETNSAGNLPHGKMEKSPRWKGGISSCGKYIRVRVYKDNPFFPMATKTRHGAGEIPQHRLVMAEHLGRLLTTKEHVHHINGDTKDNRIKNLELVSQANHVLYDKMCSHCSLREENRRLRQENRQLKAQLPP